MCKGTTTTMACGHHLLHYTVKCPSANAVHCSQIDMKRVFIDDTCAECDSGVQKTMMQGAYEQHRRQVTHQYSEAAKAGDKKAMREIEWEAIMNTGRAKTQNFQSGRSRTNVDVQWN